MVVLKKAKRSNMSAKGLSGMISFIPEYIIIHIGFPLSLKLKKLLSYEYKSRLGIPRH